MLLAWPVRPHRGAQGFPFRFRLRHGQPRLRCFHQEVALAVQRAEDHSLVTTMASLPKTDEHNWLERSPHPDLGSGCITYASPVVSSRSATTGAAMKHREHR
jgi:hypothetical protein